MESCPPMITSPLRLGDPPCNCFMRRGGTGGVRCNEGKKDNSPYFCSEQCTPSEEVSRTAWEKRADEPADTAKLLVIAVLRHSSDPQTSLRSNSLVKEKHVRRNPFLLLLEVMMNYEHMMCLCCRCCCSLRDSNMCVRSAQGSSSLCHSAQAALRTLPFVESYPSFVDL